MNKLLTNETGLLIKQALEELGGQLNGKPGLSAYEIAVKEGFTGTEEEWLESLRGDAMAQIILSLTPAPTETVKITLTNAETGNVYTEEVNSKGQAFFTVSDYGRFYTSYNQDEIEGTVELPSNITLSVPGKTYIFDGYYSSSVVYTAIIDLNNSNPLSCVTYADNAVGMIKGSNSWDLSPIFNRIRPCVFKDGKVVYYLNKENFNQKADYSPANLDGTDGDVMIEFSKFAYKIYKENNKLYVSITNNKNIAEAQNYKYYAFSKEREGDRDYFYYGAFKGSMDANNHLQSTIDQVPAHSKTIDAFKLFANIKGDGYTITSYFQLVAIQCLYIIKYGNLNGQMAVGNGVSGIGTAIATGGTVDKGMFYGSQADFATHVKLFGIEDFWGNIWEWIDGLTTDNSYNIITNWDYNSITSNENFVTPTDITENISGYVSDVVGTTEAGFMNIKYQGSSTTYFCDYGYLSSGRVLLFGGDWSNGGGCGPFYLYASHAASDAYSYVGARLMYL